ncbi:MFS transporter [Planktothrix sp. FACHB-1355]|uniref:MFS transporter n=2 Tax=Aerosakkonema funiforme TaxID=1246630 RepID=A0A926VJQ8_9CYAN|nr:MFS transporter [Planktothrix sp. FACHB-1355]MBD2185070.1 MFS transporter [Aerosakkonema funiforme FACHB-1375]MBD3559803.1 MFS transporter [Planktothrix sp. FACHB-1355]
MFPTDPSTASSNGFGNLLKKRPFMALWIGQIVSQVADKVFFILLISLVAEYQEQAQQGFGNSMRSAAMVAFTLPAILFGSGAGIFVDRFSKKQTMIASNVIRELLIIVLALLPKQPEQFLILLLLTFAISTVTQFFAPAEQAAIPLVVRHEELMSANALFAASTMGALIVGMIIGSPMLNVAHKWGGDYGREIFVGGLYLLSAVIIQFMRSKEKRIADKQVAVHPLTDLKAGLRYLKHNRLVSNAMVQLTILYSVFAALTVLAIELAPQIGLNNENGEFSFLLGAAGIGMVFGAGILGYWGDRLHSKPLPLVGFFIMSFVLAMFTLTTKIWLGLSLSVFLGVGAALIGVPMQTVIQQQTPEYMRGTVFGFENNAVNIALSLPLAITGPLTDALNNLLGADEGGANLGLRVVLLGMSLLVCVAGVWAWRNTRHVLQDVI